MQLTLYTDYALRTLIYLTVRPERVVPVSEISTAFGVSSHHLAKVAKDLTRAGYVATRRGREGGLVLARPAAGIGVAEVVRALESHDLLECFDREHSQCRLTGHCRLERALREARAAFFAVLEGYTLADLAENAPQLLRLLSKGQRAAARGVAQRG
jgi:Rrf2 family transcriptional regulator, nitric oxide-sensitive transcriptional repressor